MAWGQLRVQPKKKKKERERERKRKDWGVPTGARQSRIQLVFERTWVQSPASLCGLKIQRCRELWGRLQTRLRFRVAVAVTWELLDAAGAALNRGKEGRKAELWLYKGAQSRNTGASGSAHNERTDQEERSLGAQDPLPRDAQSAGSTPWSSSAHCPGSQAPRSRNWLGPKPTVYAQAASRT